VRWNLQRQYAEPGRWNRYPERARAGGSAGKQPEPERSKSGEASGRQGAGSGAAAGRTVQKGAETGSRGSGSSRQAAGAVTRITRRRVQAQVGRTAWQAAGTCVAVAAAAAAGRQVAGELERRAQVTQNGGTIQRTQQAESAGGAGRRKGGGAGDRGRRQAQA